ncbi:hypothetical protein K438DRAFT_1780780 [Mycena galopus ATCC 62051]|nr:hypothetical protein K438DRAFT_1780780 [Mycena galopus ATCC 62051]
MYHGMEENGLPTPNSRRRYGLSMTPTLSKPSGTNGRRRQLAIMCGTPKSKRRNGCKQQSDGGSVSAAKKLARRQRDSSKKERIRLSEETSFSEENKLGEFPKNPDISLPKTGAQMILGLMVRKGNGTERYHANCSYGANGVSSDCVHDLLYGSQPLRVQGEAEGSDETGPMVPNPHKMLPRDPEAWSYLAPRYDNRELAAATRSHPVADWACGSQWLWLAGDWNIDFMCDVRKDLRSLVPVYSR